MLSFENFLKSKKINPYTFQKAQKEVYSRWETEFNQISPPSFLAQKKFLINDIRRLYPWLEE